MRPFRSLAVSLLVVAITGLALGCQQPARDTRAEDEQAIRDAEDVQMLEAARAKDVERLMSFYAEDAVGFPAHAPMTRGKEAWAPTWSEIVEYPSFTWQTTKVEVSRSSDLAYSLAPSRRRSAALRANPSMTTGSGLLFGRSSPTALGNTS